MLSANAFDENRQQALEAGIDDFMGKPIDMRTLYQMIERHLGAHPMHKPYPRTTPEKVTEDDLLMLSKASRDTFIDALRELNPTKINDALINVRQENPELAERLGYYLEAMQYRQLWQLFGILDEQ